MTINCGGKIIDFKSPRILGILNVTPDSFFDGGRLKSEQSVIDKTKEMLEEGADFIDIGGYSSRPGAKDVTVSEEISRVVPIVKTLKREFPNILLSIDTFRSEVAKACLAQGAVMINDISASNLDAAMLPTVAEFQVPYIMMHMKGTPQTMKSLASYTNVTSEVCFYFSEKIAEARALGINDVVIDAGFGFAKTTAHNFKLLTQLHILQQLEVPILTGVSRKSMIYKTIGSTAQQALNGTSALHMIALQKGSNILRVHDVKEAKECILLHQALKLAENA